MARDPRQPLSFILVALSAVMVAASAAFACTWYGGVMTVTGDGGGTVEAIGSGQAMVSCRVVGETFVGRPGQIHVSVAPYLGDGCPNLQLPDTTVAADPDAGAVGAVVPEDPTNPDSYKGIDLLRTIRSAGEFGARVYTVTWSVNGEDCMNGGAGSVNQAVGAHVTHGNPTPGGQIKPKKIHPEAHSSEIVISQGSGSGTYVIPATVLTPSEGAVCVSSLDGGFGNQAPITFV